MVEISVDVPDAEMAHGLLRRLAGVFGRSSVSFDGVHQEVRVRSEWESRAVLQVLDAVEAWLDESGVPSARLRMGNRDYTIAGRAAVTSMV